MGATRPINIVIAGLGGQGVLKASDIVADAAFRAGFDVKKSELHGMSQRGGSVTSDIRFGESVLSPMIPEGEADFLVAISPEQAEPHHHLLRPEGTLIHPGLIDAGALKNRRSLNVALLGKLSRSLQLPDEAWMEAIRANLPEKLQEVNLTAFALGRKA